jgi:IclR family transcriptional regulator, acetate operon repressor
MKPATRYPGTQAVRRSVGLLKAFTAERPQRGLAELARAVGLNKTTAFRMLAALEGEGMVERTPAGDAYRLGPELLLLAGRAGGAHDLRAAARAELEALARATRETATLEVLVGRETLILDEATGGHMVGARPSLGTSWPAHATSTGKVLLAYLEGERRDAVLRGSWPVLTPRTVPDAAALDRALVRVRAQGFALAQEELEAGFVAVAAPVRDATGAVVAALSVGGPKARLTADTLASCARRVAAAAQKVSTKLGHAGSQRPARPAPTGRKSR